MRLFITNRPNYCHKRFAETVGCRFYHVKHFIPENLPWISLPLNGWLNAFSLPESEVFFSESIMDFYPVYYKQPLGKKIILLAEDTLFKMVTMNRLKKKFLIKLFRSADGFIAISDLCKRMILKYVSKPVKVAYPFPHEEFFHVKADVESKNVLFVGRNDKTKGFLELVEAVKILRKKDEEWELYLVGECGDAVEKEDGIHPLGFVKDMSPYFKKCAFFVQPAQFDACPATVFEAMNAGMIPVISRNIGQTDIFEANGLDNLILEGIKPETIARKLEKLSGEDNRKLSSRLRNLSKGFREKERLKTFRKGFEALVDEINASDTGVRK